MQHVLHFAVGFLPACQTLGGRSLAANGCLRTASLNGSHKPTKSCETLRGTIVCPAINPLSNNTVPRIVDSIPRRGPQPGWPHFPEVVLRNAQTLQHDLAPDRVGWPVLIFGAIAIAITIETAQILRDKLTGVTRQSRSERKEVQEAARRAAEGNSPRAPADAREDPELVYLQQVFKRDRLAERNRGLLWLAAVTLTVLWIAGWFEPDAQHPYIF
mmetsp:Transcript_4502/g.12969  ORF Transcript_4502/g.12969 Transcript_4502/m.12969 type:complete len:215 (-) Transcript_4502:622-1266(-)